MNAAVWVWWHPATFVLIMLSGGMFVTGIVNAIFPVEDRVRCTALGKCDAPDT